MVRSFTDLSPIKHYSKKGLFGFLFGFRGSSGTTHISILCSSSDSSDDEQEFSVSGKKRYILLMYLLLQDFSNSNSSKCPYYQSPLSLHSLITWNLQAARQPFSVFKSSLNYSPYSNSALPLLPCLLHTSRPLYFDQSSKSVFPLLFCVLHKSRHLHFI